MLHGDLGAYAALGAALHDVANLHRDSCDLGHPGTPATAVGIVQLVGNTLTYVLLGDVTLLLNMYGAGLSVVGDYRIRTTSPDERAEANSYPAGSVEKQNALMRMKQRELAARNVDGGYWAAASDPTVIQHAITASIPIDALLDVAILTDGAARLVDPFSVTDWAGLLDLLNVYGAGELLRRVRHAEESGSAWVSLAAQQEVRRRDRRSSQDRSGPRTRPGTMRTLWEQKPVRAPVAGVLLAAACAAAQVLAGFTSGPLLQIILLAGATAMAGSSRLVDWRPALHVFKNPCNCRIYWITDKGIDPTTPGPSDPLAWLEAVLLARPAVHWGHPR